LNCTSGQSVIRGARSRVGVVLQAAGARPGGGKRVARVEHGTRLHREASAADAAGQLVLESLESVPALLELLLPCSGCALPVLMARRTIQRHRVEYILHALERDAEVARDRDERHPAQHVARETTLVALGAHRDDEAEALVVAQRGDGHARAPTHLADREQVVRVGLNGRHVASSRLDLKFTLDISVRLTASTVVEREWST